VNGYFKAGLATCNSENKCSAVTSPAIEKAEQDFRQFENKRLLESMKYLKEYYSLVQQVWTGPKVCDRKFVQNWNISHV
jgi:hypothetical protein